MLIAPKRGTPPEIPEGYERYNGDPYIFVPKLQNCQYREMRQPASRCCGNANYMHCRHFEKTVTRNTCMECKVNDVG